MMESTAQKNEGKEKEGKLITPRGDEPMKGKTEIKENSWNTDGASERSTEG